MRREGGQERELPAVRGPDHALSVPAQVAADRGEGPATSDAGNDRDLARIDDLRRSLAARGFNILLPLGEQAFDEACAPVAPELRLRALHPGATHALVVGSGGPQMFAHFRAAPESHDGQRDPLDRFTRAAVTAAAADALAALPGGYHLYFPYTSSVPALPFQRLGRAAGMGRSSPLGLQVHPVFGPWWAYRGLIVLGLGGGGARAELVTPSIPVALVAPPPEVGDGCAGCSAPCVQACPAGAVRVDGFSVAACHARRLVAPECHLSCVARIRCVRGPEHRYSDDQLAFHMAASMPTRAPA